jgi:hypothetical protein
MCVHCRAIQAHAGAQYGVVTDMSELDWSAMHRGAALLLFRLLTKVWDMPLLRPGASAPAGATGAAAAAAAAAGAKLTYPPQALEALQVCCSSRFCFPLTWTMVFIALRWSCMVVLPELCITSVTLNELCVLCCVVQLSTMMASYVQMALQRQLLDVAAIITRVAEKMRVHLSQRAETAGVGGLLEDPGVSKRQRRQAPASIEGEKLADMRHASLCSFLSNLAFL